VNDLNERLISGVEEMGGTVVTPDQHGALICIRSTDAKALVSALDADGIVTSERDSNLRVSAHAYNTTDDVDTVLDALRRHRELLA
jgi:selenocysteine lyase/cysteine desulfurase